ncbi:MAG: DMT family transporter [Candidatus Sericytochromatia bacterium]
MKRKLSYLLLILATLCWGAAFVVIKVGTAGFSPYAFLAWRYLLAALALGLCFPRLLTRIAPATLRAGLVLSLPLAAGTVIQTIGLGLTSASNTAFITGMTLIFLPLLKFFLEGLRLQRVTLLANAIALTGLAILTVKLPLVFNRGDLWVLASTLAYALHIILTGRFVRHADPMALSLVQLAGCGLLCTLPGLVNGSGLPLPPSAQVWQAIVFTGLLATAFTYTAQVVAQQHLEDHKVALIFLLEPVFGCLAANLFLHEPFSLRLLLGGGLILAAITLAELRASGPLTLYPAEGMILNQEQTGDD